MSIIQVQGNQIGLLYSSGICSSFEPVIEFTLEQNQFGSWKLQKKYVYYGWEKRTEQHPQSWSNDFTQSEVYKDAVRQMYAELAEKLSHIGVTKGDM